MSLWQFGQGGAAAVRAIALAEGLRHGPPDALPASRPFAVEFGVRGAGISASGNGLVPVVFVETKEPMFKLGTTSINEFPGAVEAIKRALPSASWADGVMAVPVPPLRLQANPGDPISAAKLGQLGAPVRWGAGAGYLTAGHVAQARGAAVQDAAGTTIGTAIEVLTPASGTPGSDVAIVDLAPTQHRGNKLGINCTGRAQATNAVDVHTRTGAVSTTIFGYAAWFYISLSQVTVSDVYQTGVGVTAAADSGGPAVLSGSSAVIGHIVAGGTATTCVQDIHTQLRDLSVLPGFHTIRI